MHDSCATRALAIAGQRPLSRTSDFTAAGIPVAVLTRLVRSGKLQRGMKVAMVAFGSGFTWASALVRWG